MSWMDNLGGTKRPDLLDPAFSTIAAIINRQAQKFIADGVDTRLKFCN